MKQIVRLSLTHIIVLVVTLSGWEAFGRSSARRGFLFGTPSAVGRALWVRVCDGSILTDLGITAGEAIAGLMIGTVMGSAIGLALWLSPGMARLVRPYIVLVGSVPVLALAPVVIVWFGIGLLMKIAMASVGTLFVALVQAYEGARNVDAEHIRLLRILGAKRPQIFRRVVIPCSLAWVFASLKLNVGFAILGAFIGEFIASEAGLGHLILRAGSLYDVPVVFAGSAVIVALALGFTWIVAQAERRKYRVIQWLSVPGEVIARGHKLSEVRSSNRVPPAA